ncbi:anoctamin-10-like isoform X2 [Acanthaster planci]|uniref:Anoctamin n=1 Tax=Acanthaster planci TaxID=133434 RepID=A0A8B7XQZ6_ACAPL|nr:anoctamin-10-like isoform X1 [Acanthaster planci]XP_022082420.1 anoctamin-10-like isoform X2 [Acanthaster planci]
MPAIQRQGAVTQVNGHSHQTDHHDGDPHHDDHDGHHHHHYIQDLHGDILTHEGGHLRPLVIMEISEKTTEETRKWLIERIEAPPENGGAGLKARQSVSENGGGMVLEIGALRERLLEGAERACLKKKCKDGTVREFTRVHSDQFECEEPHFLTTCDCQRIIYYLLLHIRNPTTSHIPGTNKLVLYEKQRIIPKLMDAEIVTHLYPLHIASELSSLTKIWYKSFNSLNGQPIERIREYFGEALAIYFSFLGFYTAALVLPAVVGLLSYLLAAFLGPPSHGYALFAIFNLLWTTLFLEAWKRKCAGMAYSWGTYGMVKFEEPRPQFYGPLHRNPITGREEPHYPKWKRNMKKFGVSLPVILGFLVVAFGIMLASFTCEDYIKARMDITKMPGSVVFLLPSMIYAVAIVVINKFYRQLASYLNDWENHRLNSTHENNLIMKLIVFDFANCFMALFYVAFYQQDMVRLQKYLATLLIVQQLIEQFLETGLPYLILRFWRKGDKVLEAAEKKKDDDANVEAAKGLAEEQSKMDVYPGTFDDYLELFLQFGYVFLFSAVYPLAALWALLNNIIEIRSDAFKISRVCQRPFGQSAEDIGTWQVVFEIMGIVAVLTNTSLMAMSPEVKAFFPDMSATHYILMFVAFEHILLGLKAAIAILIPDLPKWMEVELAREEFESRQAFLQMLAEKRHAEEENKQLEAAKAPLEKTSLEEVGETTA